MTKVGTGRLVPNAWVDAGDGWITIVQRIEHGIMKYNEISLGIALFTILVLPILEVPIELVVISHILQVKRTFWLGLGTVACRPSTDHRLILAISRV